MPTETPAEPNKKTETLAALKKQRSVNKGKLTNILTYVEKVTKSKTETSMDQLKTRLARVEKLMEEFTAIEGQIFLEDDAQNPDLEYEENYYLAVSGLNRCMRESSLASRSTTHEIFENTFNNTINPHVHTKLPKINIPPFSGEYIEWQSFYDLFSSTIHESNTLSAVQKFQYLKGLLRGEAEVLLRHMSITEANYIEALQKLKSRYDRKKIIINSFIRTFIEQPSITNANASNVKRLMDTADEVVRGLKALGTAAEGRDSWLIYILTEKLDSNTKLLWAQASAENEQPELGDLLKFLALRIDTLESVTSPVNKASKKPIIKSYVASNTYQCSLCTKNHLTYQCPDFNEMDVLARRNWVKSNNRCFNCLSMKHAVFQCKSKYRCHSCKKKHHTLLHVDETIDSQEPIDENKLPGPSNTTRKIISGHTHGSSVAYQSILPTVTIRVINASGQTTLCRAMLDSGSQASFITERCVQQLGLVRKNARVSLSGIGTSDAGITRGIVTIQIKPDDGSNLIVETFILKTITSQLPEGYIELPHKSWPNLKLADHGFCNQTEIDVLIGIDHFFQILKKRTNKK